MTLLACVIIAGARAIQGTGPHLARPAAGPKDASEAVPALGTGPAQEASAAQQLPLRYVLDPARTTVGFFARASLGDFRGRTSTVLGWVELSDTVLLGDARGEVEVQLAALKTGIGMRDADMRQALETGRYPIASFHLTAVEPAAPKTGDTAAAAAAPGVPPAVAELMAAETARALPSSTHAPAQEVTQLAAAETAGAAVRRDRPPRTEGATGAADRLRRITIRGDLTIHGTTRAVAFDASYRFAEDTLRVAGETEIRLPDFGIRKPRRFFGLLQVDEQVRIEFDALFLRQRVEPAPPPASHGILSAAKVMHSPSACETSAALGDSRGRLCITYASLSITNRSTIMPNAVVPAKARPGLDPRPESSMALDAGSSPA